MAHLMDDNTNGVIRIRSFLVSTVAIARSIVESALDEMGEGAIRDSLASLADVTDRASSESLWRWCNQSRHGLMNREDDAADVAYDRIDSQLRLLGVISVYAFEPGELTVDVVATAADHICRLVRMENEAAARARLRVLADAPLSYVT